MLAQLATVKARCGVAASDVADNTLLTNFIKWASALFDQYCHRTFERGTGVKDEFWGDDMQLRLSRYPVEMVTKFETKSSETEGWIEATNVDIILVAKSGIVSLSDPLAVPFARLCVTYNGGYVLPGATPDTGQTALAADVENACVEQVTYWYQRKNQLGLTAVSMEGGSIQQFQSLKLLPAVEMTLRPYQRFLM